MVIADNSNHLAIYWIEKKNWASHNILKYAGNIYERSWTWQQTLSAFFYDVNKPHQTCDHLKTKYCIWRPQEIDSIYKKNIRALLVIAMQSPTLYLEDNWCVSCNVKISSTYLWRRRNTPHRINVPATRIQPIITNLQTKLHSLQLYMSRSKSRNLK